MTRKEYIEEHRKMWLWICREIAYRKYSVDILDLKVEYCNIHRVRPYSYCFCCDYAIHINYEHRCMYCPLVWGQPHQKCYHTLYGKIIATENWKKQVKLAYKIATLPESEYLYEKCKNSIKVFHKHIINNQHNFNNFIVHHNKRH